jgi:hypothetical protein
VVAQRDHVCAGSEELVGELRRQADAVGGVLAVHDAKVDVELVAQGPQAPLDRPPARRADDIGDEENPQGSRLAPECASIETWLPASCV